ncbi:MAG: hypothetical protein IT166_13670 [Bryobacterales bacterium]|nr:hypothetical protein [Bryobacterales bacterium]
MTSVSSLESVDKPVLRAYVVLRIAFTIVPIIAGIDQFTNKLAEWDMYLAPVATRILPVSARTFMMLAGAAEIVAGLITAFAPRIGGWIVAVWLWLIIINLLAAQGFYDTALRDFGLSLGAVALALLGAGFHRKSLEARPAQTENRS